MKRLKQKQLKEQANQRATLKLRFRQAVLRAARLCLMGKGGMRREKVMKKESVERMIMKRHGIAIRHFMIELQKKILVDSSENISQMRLCEIEQIKDPAWAHKNSNHISIISGAPSFYSLDLDRTGLMADKTKVFPLKNIIYDQATLDAKLEKQTACCSAG